VGRTNRDNQGLSIFKQEYSVFKQTPSVSLPCVDPLSDVLARFPLLLLLEQGGDRPGCQVIPILLDGFFCLCRFR
jgi:hypothetical protein